MNELVGFILRSVEAKGDIFFTAPENIDMHKVAKEIGWNTEWLFGDTASIKFQEMKAALFKATGILRYTIKPPVAGFLSKKKSYF